MTTAPLPVRPPAASAAPSGIPSAYNPQLKYRAGEMVVSGGVLYVATTAYPVVGADRTPETSPDWSRVSAAGEAAAVQSASLGGGLTAVQRTVGEVGTAMVLVGDEDLTGVVIADERRMVAQRGGVWTLAGTLRISSSADELVEVSARAWWGWTDMRDGFDVATSPSVCSGRVGGRNLLGLSVGASALWDSGTAAALYVAVDAPEGAVVAVSGRLEAVLPR